MKISFHSFLTFMPCYEFHSFLFSDGHRQWPKSYGYRPAWIADERLPPSESRYGNDEQAHVVGPKMVRYSQRIGRRSNCVQPHQEHDHRSHDRKYIFCFGHVVLAIDLSSRVSDTRCDRSTPISRSTLLCKRRDRWSRYAHSLLWRCESRLT